MTSPVPAGGAAAQEEEHDLGGAGPGHPPDETARPPYLSETTL